MGFYVLNTGIYLNIQIFVDRKYSSWKYLLYFKATNIFVYSFVKKTETSLYIELDWSSWKQFKKFESV